MSSVARLRLESLEAPGLRFRADTDKVSIVLDSTPGHTDPNPMQAMLAAVGGCSGMDVISILRKKRQQVTGYEIEVVAERAEQHPRVYTRIEVIHRVRGRDLSAVAIEEAIRLSDTKYCSIHAMLEPKVALSSRFEIVPE